jgi:hypothetical protein
MCFFLFPKPPKKRRYYPIDTSEEDLIPRKRRATHHSARPVKYEPLRGHGVKRNTAVKVQPSVLRGQGVKRDPVGEKRQVFSDNKPTASSKSVKSTPSKRRVEHTASRRKSHHDSQKRRSDGSSARSPRSQHQAPEMTQAYQTAYAPANTSQYRYSYPETATREHPLYTNQTPGYVYSMPKCYYHDIGAVRAATSHALQESMFDAARFEANRVAYSRNLRRQPAYTQLRY